MARLIERLLKKHSRRMYMIILGLLTGSVYALFNNPVVYQSGTGAVGITAGIILLIVGCLLSFFIGRRRV
jgi:uncharacterized membrane protein